ncbi:hypothetical protein KC19_2G158300 [Ceratodon purpureus]|uniref:Uncharacterized protein n=1 Tax=Ceratodon purpureus TaxID=3225 RepID=A0A8T0IX28_CERPU|nr:hypothetical protein KC19_2G158300 [Ceratodon purpureus]
MTNYEANLKTKTATPQPTIGTPRRSQTTPEPQSPRIAETNLKKTQKILPPQSLRRAMRSKYKTKNQKTKKNKKKQKTKMSKNLRYTTNSQHCEKQNRETLTHFKNSNAPKNRDKNNQCYTPNNVRLSLSLSPSNKNNTNTELIQNQIATKEHPPTYLSRWARTQPALKLTHLTPPDLTQSSLPHSIIE